MSNTSGSPNSDQPITHAMLLAAGLGNRMRPLTDHCPKPLLEVGGRALIEHHLDRMVKLGITEVIINTSYLAEQIQQRLGDGKNYGVNISYSHEPEPLETAGGIKQALPLLGEGRFLVINADVWIQFDFAAWLDRVQQASVPVSLVMADNPTFHPKGDFYLMSNGLVQDEMPSADQAATRLTYAGIGVYSVDLFRAMPGGKVPLAPWLRDWMAKVWVEGIHHAGDWSDVGTPERLTLLRKQLATSSLG